MSGPENIRGRKGHVIIDEFFSTADPALLPYQKEWLEDEGAFVPFARPTDPAPDILAWWLQ